MDRYSKVKVSERGDTVCALKESGNRCFEREREILKYAQNCKIKGRYLM